MYVSLHRHNFGAFDNIFQIRCPTVRILYRYRRAIVGQAQNGQSWFFLLSEAADMTSKPAGRASASFRKKSLQVVLVRLSTSKLSI